MTFFFELVVVFFGGDGGKVYVIFVIFGTNISPTYIWVAVFFAT